MLLPIHALLALVTAIPLVCSQYTPTSNRTCSSGAFSNLVIEGASVTNIAAISVSNFTYNDTRGLAPTIFSNLSFCNVTVTYTHTGQSDSIIMTTWLPLTGWNGRFQGLGGGGYVTGNPDSTHPLSVSQGFAAGSTDGGHYGSNAPVWALNSTGQVNHQLLEDFASLALHEIAVIGKSVTKIFYGTPPQYSYWYGCSTGGRQGLMLAQRYPLDFNGIVALAPAINWPTFIVAEYWPQFVMNQLGVYPPACEFKAISDAAVAACDGLDGVLDKIISAPGLCNFDPRSVVGQPFNCFGQNLTISSAAANIALEVWKGPFSANGTRLWFGLTPDTSFQGLVGTNCTSNTTCQSGSPFSISQQWLSLFVLENRAANLSALSLAQYSNLFQAARDKYQSIIGTADADLSRFRDAGGKLLTWHGMADPLIFHNGTNTYYEDVLKHDASARNFYRYFRAPGVGHCAPYVGPYPTGEVEAVIRWVEAGVAPSTLPAITVNSNGTQTGIRQLCPYPLVSQHIGGTSQAPLFICAESF